MAASQVPLDEAAQKASLSAVTTGPVQSPFATDAPTAPAEPPIVWTLVAFARREFEQAASPPSRTVNTLAAQTTNGPATLDGQAADATVAIGPALNAPATPATFTGQPSIVAQIFSAVFRVVGAVGNFLGVDLVTPLGHLLSSDRPPWFTTLGLNVQRSEFEGMPVWILQSPGSTSEKIVVAIPGSAFVWPPTVFHWFSYAAMASNTGATVMVPVYPLVPQGRHRRDGGTRHGGPDFVPGR